MPLDDRYLHLKEIQINFIGRLPTSLITLHLQVDDTSHDFKPERREKVVKWNCGIYISRRSRLTLRILRVKNGIRNFLAESVVTEIVLKAGGPGIKENSVCSRSDSHIRADFAFEDSIERKTFIGLMGKDIKSALATKVILLNRMKDVSSFLKIVLSVGKEMSELNGVAKAAFGLANQLFKVLQEQQEFHHMAVDLAELLDVKLYLSDIIPERLRQGSVQKSLKDMLDIIEEILKFIKAHIDCSSLNSLFARRGNLTDLKARLFAASEDLSLCLTANVFVMVSSMQSNMDDGLLKEKLKPVLPARSSVDHYCLEGTREVPLEHILDWGKAVNPPRKLYHTHGVAGSGKSSMASTICEKLDNEKMLAGAFFCKRDVPDQRDPSRILPSLSYTLALRCKAYKERVMRALEEEPDITSRSIEQQLKVLFREPLADLSLSSNQSKPLIFVIDALDECGDDVSRPRLADSLCQIVTFTDYLKVFVTSRPTNELIRKFSNSAQILSVNLNDTDAEKDIRLYTRASLKQLVDGSGLSSTWLTEDTVQKLTLLASGLFIWTSTMIKYVRGQLDMDNAMKLVLSGDVAAAEASLDDLYIKVIESSGSGDNNLMLKKAVLGIVFITTKNKPLSIDGLYDFLQGTGQQVTKGTLVAVINHLRSVLYEDVSKGNVIRVCHPSFLDFLENRERSGMYWANVEQLHATMVETSLNLMKTMLKFNICGFQTSYAANKDVDDLSQKIKDSIPESLIYSCLYWTTHFTEANRTTTDVVITGFFQCMQVVYWIELLSLVGGVKIGLDALQCVLDFFKDNRTICSLATDLYRLVSSSYDAISYSTPHLYISALAWLPEKSPLRPIISRIASDALIAIGRNENWPSMLWIYTISGGLGSIAFSPDNETIAACSLDGKIYIFNAKTGILEMKLQDRDNDFVSFAFSPDGKRLISGSTNKTAIIWNLHTGDVVGKPLAGHSQSVTSAAYSPDGQFIASHSWDGETIIWDVQSGAIIRVQEDYRKYGCLAYSHDGAKLACCGEEGIIVRNAHNGDVLNELKDIGHIFDLAYSQDGRFLASGGRSNVVRVWDAETLTTIAEHKGHASYAYSVIFSLDGSTLYSASIEGKMIRWDMSSSRMNGVAVQESDIRSAACSSDGRLYASASEDGSLRVWNAGSHFLTEPLSVNDRLLGVACSPGGNEIASASSNGVVYIRSLGSGSLLRTLKGHTDEVNTVVYSSDGKLVASGSDDRTVRVWDSVTGSELRKFEGHTDWVANITFTADDKQIVSSSADGTVRRWVIDGKATGGEILHSQTSGIQSMCVSQTGKILAIGERDGLIQFGDISSGMTRELRLDSSTKIRTLVFSPDDSHLASGSEDKEIQLWHLETETLVRKYVGHTDYVLSLSFSRDGQQLLSSSGDNTTRQWCVETGNEMRRLRGHTHAVSCSIYSLDEKHIISCSEDGTIRIWNADIKEEICIAEIGKNLASLKLEDGWIKSNNGELLLWVPSEYRNGLRDMCERCIPADASGHPVRLDWSKLVKGECWTDVLIPSTWSELKTS